MNNLSTFSELANPAPDGQYHPFLPREQVSYPGPMNQYAFNPEHMHFRSTVAPPPVMPPGMGADPLTGLPSYSDDATSEDSRGDSDTGAPSPSESTGSNPSVGPLGSLTAPTLSTVTDVAEAITSPLGKIFSAPLPFSSVAQLAAHATLSEANRAKTNRVIDKEQIAPNEFGNDPSSSTPGQAEAGTHGATGGLGPGGMGGTSNQGGADPTGGLGPGGMGGVNPNSEGAIGSGPADSGSGVNAILEAFGIDPSGPGENGNGTAGMGDSPGSPSGTWHKGGMVYDGDLKTFKDNVDITAQEGEYIMPRNVVDTFGPEFLDLIRQAAAKGIGVPRGTGEMQGMRERVQRHG